MENQKLCGGCLDPDACIPDTWCAFAEKTQSYFNHLDTVMKGKTQMSNAPKKTTAADVAAQAAEEKLVVPTQADKPAVSTVEITEDGVSILDEQDTPELTVIEGEKGAKKSFKERVSELGEKLKANKKALALTVAAVGVTTVAVVTFVKTQAVAALDEVVAEEVELDRAKKLLTEDKHTISEVADILGVSTAALQRALDTDSPA
jgi:hypothetical protein